MSMEPPANAYERPGFATGAVSAGLGLLLVLVPLGLAAVALLMKLSLGALSLPDAPAPALPQPRLQLAPAGDLAVMRRREAERLHAGAVVPIEQAMGLIARRGSAAFDPLVAAQRQEAKP